MPSGFTSVSYETIIKTLKEQPCPLPFYVKRLHDALPVSE
jgi:hypothetical protein